MQGGIHPEFTGETYLKAVKKAVPELHVHALSPLEVFQGASTLGVSIEEFLVELKNAGLSSLPCTVAEFHEELSQVLSLCNDDQRVQTFVTVLDDKVRSLVCPDKINTNQWLEVYFYLPISYADLILCALEGSYHKNSTMICYHYISIP